MSAAKQGKYCYVGKYLTRSGDLAAAARLTLMQGGDHDRVAHVGSVPGD